MHLNSLLIAAKTSNEAMNVPLKLSAVHWLISLSMSHNLLIFLTHHTKQQSMHSFDHLQMSLRNSCN